MPDASEPDGIGGGADVSDAINRNGERTMNIRAIFLTVTWSVFAMTFTQANEPENCAVPIGDGHPAPRSLSAIRDDVRNALREEASTRRMGDNTREVRRLVDIYNELAVYPKHDKSIALSRLGQRLRTRLEKICSRIERQIPDPDWVGGKQEVATNVVLVENHVLAQRAPLAGGAAIRQGAPQAGPRAAAEGPREFGPDLIELIQRTISPEVWDVNGGNSSMVYYAPLRVLVVRAPY